MSEKPSLDFATPDYSYDELEDQLAAYVPNPAKYPHGKTYFVYRDGGSPEAGELTNWELLPPGFQGLGSRLVVEEAQCAPELKEISRQVWLNSIGPAVNEFLDRY